MWRRAGAAVVVGVDGSESSLRAVRAAAQLAVERQRTLRVVHAFIWPLMHVPLGPAPAGPPEGGLRHEADRILADAVTQARLIAGPAGHIDGVVVPGDAAAVLVREAADAAMIVIGDRGLGGFTGLLVGSVAMQLTAHASCPVVVVRGADLPDGPVVVGVDGSGHSDLAIDFAFEEASFRGAALRAVHSWTHPAQEPGVSPAPLYDRDQAEDEERRVLAESVAGRCDQYPDIEVELRVVHGGARRVLIAESDSAQLVVVGARGRGGFRGLALGSVSHALLHHAACPLAVVRSADHVRPK